MGRNRALGTPYQTEIVADDFTTHHAVDAYMVDAVPIVVMLDPYAVNGDQVLIQDITNSAASNPIVIANSSTSAAYTARRRRCGNVGAGASAQR